MKRTHTVYWSKRPDYKIKNTIKIRDWQGAYAQTYAVIEVPGFAEKLTFRGSPNLEGDGLDEDCQREICKGIIAKINSLEENKKKTPFENAALTHLQTLVAA